MRDWIDEVNPRFSFEVTERYTLAKGISNEDVAAAHQVKEQVLERMNQLLTEGTVVCLPSTVGPAPPIGQRLSERTSLRLLTSQLTYLLG